MMAAGLIILAHRSGGPKADLIIDGQTGFLADDLDSYATTMEQIFTMTDNQRNDMQNIARDSLYRFDRLNFESLFFQSIDQIFSSK